jgi:apolipoprotein N-acyltransferase
MAKKNRTIFNKVWILFASATFLLSAGWLMKVFPLFIFIGIAPLFAISDIAKEKDSPWNHLEIILLALAISFFAAHAFNISLIIPVLAEAMLLTLAFAGYTFTYQNLGSRIGKFTIIFFWLGFEYLMLKLPWRNNFYFLADALALQGDWWKWNLDLGYLGISLWVLVVNLFFFLGIFKSSTIKWIYLILAVLLIVIPIIYSIYYLNTPGINRTQMISLYDGSGYNLNINYTERGELITRSSAWVSVLILLSAIVKNKVKKK